MQITIPKLSLVVLIGPSGSGKSTFARKHFPPTQVLSSDFRQDPASEDKNVQSSSADAIAALHTIIAKRLGEGLLTVVDTTNIYPSARKSLVNLTRQYHCPPVAIVFDLPEKLCLERNRNRTDRQMPEYVIHTQVQDLKHSQKSLKREGFRHIYTLKTPAEADAAGIILQPLWNDRHQDRGPFDIIGDVHGCIDELRALLRDLGYVISRVEDGQIRVTSPESRRVVFLGDLVDRGPGIVEVLRLVMAMTASGTALCVPGNHDMKLLRKLNGRNVQITHGLADSLEQLAGQNPQFIESVRRFLDGLVSHYVLDDGDLVVAHAGMKESMQGRDSGAVREFALYGETTGETDEYGLPVRGDWAARYQGRALVIYGHTPRAEVQMINNTCNIDTGCVFGGKMTAYRYPEGEIRQVKALRTYYEPARPLTTDIS